MLNRTPHTNSTNERGSLFIEFSIVIPIMIIIAGVIIDFGLELNNQADRVAAARELARIGAGYAAPNACQFVCGIATESICKYGLTPAHTTVLTSVANSKFSVTIGRTGSGLFAQFRPFSAPTTVSFDQESYGKSLANVFSGTGCGYCTIAGSCPAP